MKAEVMAKLLDLGIGRVHNAGLARLRRKLEDGRPVYLGGLIRGGRHAEFG